MPSHAETTFRELWSASKGPVTALSVWLAARNSMHTWATGIVGCALFGCQFFLSRLYADTSLQVFFIVTSVIGWVQWRRHRMLLRVPSRGRHPAH